MEIATHLAHITAGNCSRNELFTHLCDSKSLLVTWLKKTLCNLSQLYKCNFYGATMQITCTAEEKHKLTYKYIKIKTYLVLMVTF